MQLKRTFLLGVIGSLSLAAVLGIWVFLMGGSGHAKENILGTTLTTALFSLTALGAAVVLERARWRATMIVTFALSGLGLLVYLLVIWFDPIWGWVDDDLIFKVLFWLAAWSIALPHAGLLSLASFKGFYRFIKGGAVAAVFALALSVTLFALFEGKPDEDIWIRVIGVLGILSALGTITVPVLVKVSGIDKEESVESTGLELEITCPRCRLQQTVLTGHSRCSGCKLRFEIKIEEPRCPRCDYLLHKLTEPACPECGLELGAGEVVQSAVGPKKLGTHDA